MSLKSNVRVLITGANGFVGQNLRLFLSGRKDVNVVTFTRENSTSELPDLLSDTDFIFHLAGINRPKNPEEFISGNIELTKELSDALSSAGRKIPVIYASSIHASQASLYGKSKKSAEDILFELQASKGNPVYIFRFPNIFGKWGKPNYNSVVATFCYNLAHDLPINVNDPSLLLSLIYIDDVIARFLQIMDGANQAIDKDGFEVVYPRYTITLGELANQLLAFKDGRLNLMVGRVGTGLTRALYATYVSYLPTNKFSYPIGFHADERGKFVEILKTIDCGQFSYLTAPPGITRGGHYHNSKIEKFLVIKGSAQFRFRHMLSGQGFDIVVNGGDHKIVETIPGWTHDVTNVGNEELVMMLWANEVFDSAHPDTYICKI